MIFFYPGTTGGFVTFFLTTTGSSSAGGNALGLLSYANLSMFTGLGGGFCSKSDGAGRAKIYYSG